MSQEALLACLSMVAGVWRDNVFNRIAEYAAKKGHDGDPSQTRWGDTCDQISNALDALEMLSERWDSQDGIVLVEAARQLGHVHDRIESQKMMKAAEPWMTGEVLADHENRVKVHYELQRFRKEPMVVWPEDTKRAALPVLFLRGMTSQDSGDPLEDVLHGLRSTMQLWSRTMETMNDVCTRGDRKLELSLADVHGLERRIELVTELYARTSWNMRNRYNGYDAVLEAKQRAEAESRRAAQADATTEKP